MVCVVGMEQSAAEKPEVSPPVRGTKTKLKTLTKILVEPSRVVTYPRFAAITVTIYVASITFGTLRLLSISIQNTFFESP